LPDRAGFEGGETTVRALQAPFISDEDVKRLTEKLEQ
jgi:hypothetical protein